MARVEETAKLIEVCESGVEVEDLAQQSGDGEDLSQVEADISELMGREKPDSTLRFGSSLVSKNTINFYVGKGYFKAGECRAPKGEDTPNPLEGETVVFRDFFTAGPRFPLDPIFPEILARLNIKMHHLTPNAIIQLSKFFWAIKTFEAPVSPDAFCRFYELHPQGQKISFEGEEEIYNAQSSCCTFVTRRNNKVLKLDRIEISYSQKNKWDYDWGQYWFYTKIAFPSVSDSEESVFPLASKVMPF
ncbi:putative retrotransposon protein [Panicum miliaceum]|uniref:Retrotransposon protein n=1 Tax=Panicum miliaceum TaxID=4540 RepID=A0A3L6RD56_PANMI|nr:putative retrotransposon protein [Panicum miliaceum]